VKRSLEDELYWALRLAVSDLEARAGYEHGKQSPVTRAMRRYEWEKSPVYIADTVPEWAPEAGVADPPQRRG
jgi:hypothetical protein